MALSSPPTPRRVSVPAGMPRRSRRSIRPVAIEGLVTGEDVNREFFELMSTSAPRRSTVGRALKGLLGSPGLDAARPHLDVLLRAAQANALRDHPADAATALTHLARLAREAVDDKITEACVCAGRQLVTPEAVHALLDMVTQPGADPTELGDALALAGGDVADHVMERLNAAQDLAARRAYYDLALAFGRRPEMRRFMMGRLAVSLEDQRWYVVRNALVLLAAFHADLPSRVVQQLAGSPHRQVRLALAQVTARRQPDAGALDLLLALLVDPDAGVRFAAAVGLGRHADPRARDGLREARSTEPDAETRQAMDAALSRRTRPTLRVA